MACSLLRIAQMRPATRDSCPRKTIGHSPIWPDCDKVRTRLNSSTRSSAGENATKLCGIHPHQYIGVSLLDKLDPCRRPIAGIADNQLSRSNRQAPERFSVPLSPSGSHLKKVAHQIRQLDAVQNPPLTSGLTGLLDDGAIDDAERPRHRRTR